MLPWFSTSPEDVLGVWWKLALKSQQPPGVTIYSSNVFAQLRVRGKTLKKSVNTHLLSFSPSALFIFSGTSDQTGCLVAVVDTVPHVVATTGPLLYDGSSTYDLWLPLLRHRAPCGVKRTFAGFPGLVAFLQPPQLLCGCSAHPSVITVNERLRCIICLGKCDTLSCEFRCYLKLMCISEIMNDLKVPLQNYMQHGILQ